MGKLIRSGLAVLIGIALLSGGCEKKKDPLPECLQEVIDQISKEPVRNPPAEIWKYFYELKEVYYIPPYCCDQMSELLDANCNLICHPDGGITGGGDGKCPGFQTGKNNGVLIWKDNR